ncbi:hypothetical protein [Solidesulfovibrio sp.]
MKTRLSAIVLAALLVLAAQPGAAGTKENLVAFYEGYLALVSASDYVTLSRDDPEEFDAKFDAIAQKAGFEDSAAALTAAESLASDSEITALRQSVADKILQQYKPFRE